MKSLYQKWTKSLKSEKRKGSRAASVTGSERSNADASSVSSQPGNRGQSAEGKPGSVDAGPADAQRLCSPSSSVSASMNGKAAKDSGQVRPGWMLPAARHWLKQPACIA